MTPGSSPRSIKRVTVKSGGGDPELKAWGAGLCGFASLASCGDIRKGGPTKEKGK